MRVAEQGDGDGRRELQGGSPLELLLQAVEGSVRRSDAFSRELSASLEAVGLDP